VRLGDVLQSAVQAKTHDGTRLERFDVNVGCVVTHGLRQQRIDHANDGCVVFGFQQVGRFGQVVQQHGQVHVLFRIVQQHGGGFVGLGVRIAEHALEIFCIDQRGIDGQRQLAHHFCNGFRFGIAAHSQCGTCIAIGQYHALCLGERVGQAARSATIDIGLAHGCCLTASAGALAASVVEVAATGALTAGTGSAGCIGGNALSLSSFCMIQLSGMRASCRR